MACLARDRPFAVEQGGLDEVRVDGTTSPQSFDGIRLEP
jgi:hypothetical protein